MRYTAYIFVYKPSFHIGHSDSFVYAEVSLNL